MSQSVSNSPPVALCMTLAIPDQSGSSRMTLAYGQALSKAGYDVILLHGTRHADGKQSYVSTLRSAGIRCVLVPSFDMPIGPRHQRQVESAIVDTNASAVISCQLKDAPIAMRAARNLELPCIHFAQNFRKFEGQFGLARFKRWNYRHALQSSQCTVIANSPPVLRQHRELFGIPDERCKLVRNGLDSDSLRAAARERTAARVDLGISPATRVIIQLGRITEQKGQDIALEGFESFLREQPASDRSRYRFLIGGTAADAPKERQYARRLETDSAQGNLNGRIDWLGWIEKPAELLPAADLLLHPARWEGGCPPLVVQEAMALGIPTIFSDCAGIPDRFRPGKDGMLVQQGSSESVAQALKAFWSGSPESRKELGHLGRNYAEQYLSLAEASDQFVTIVEGLVASR